MNSFFKTHPVSLLLYFIAVIGTLMFCANPVLQIIAFLGGTTYLVYLTKGRKFISESLFYLALFLMIAVTNPLFSHNGKTPLFFMNGNPVTLEAVLCGVSIALTIISAILWFGCVTRVFDSEKFLHIFGKISPKLALVFSMALNFIPKLKKQFRTVENSQKALGIYSTESRFDRLKLKLKTLGAVVMQSAENGVEVSDSMTARGYGRGNKTSFSTFKFRLRDVVIAVFSVAVLVLEITLKLTGVTLFEFYPSVTKITLDSYNVTAFTLFFVLCFLPIIIEITENLRWKYFVSKI